MQQELGSKNIIGFWGVPNPQISAFYKEKYPDATWLDLDIDFNHPATNILPDAYCKIIKNIIDNAIFYKDKFLRIICPTGKDKCDSGWFAYKLLQDLGFEVVESRFEEVLARRDVKISTSDLPLYDKITMITGGIIDEVSQDKLNELNQCEAKFGFWGVPPNDMEILKLFPDNTHVYGWTRCVEAGCPADVDLEMFVDENVPTVFYSQAFCAKCQLAKYLADKYNGLYIDIDDYATNSVRAKIEAFLKLR